MAGYLGRLVAHVDWLGLKLGDQQHSSYFIK